MNIDEFIETYIHYIVKFECDCYDIETFQSENQEITVFHYSLDCSDSFTYSYQISDKSSKKVIQFSYKGVNQMIIDKNGASYREIKSNHDLTADEFLNKLSGYINLIYALRNSCKGF